MTDFSFSLQELDGQDWGEAEPNDTIMIKRCHALRRKPLASLALDEVGLAIRQRVGLPYILDLAVKLVSEEPLLEGEHYPGDILSALLKMPDKQWAGRMELKEQLPGIYARALAAFEDMPGEAEGFRSSLNLPDLKAARH